MESVKHKWENSTKNKPHYTFMFFSSKNEYIGEYSIYGYYLYNVYIDKNFRGKGLCKKIICHATNRKKNLVLDVKKII